MRTQAHAQHTHTRKTHTQSRHVGEGKNRRASTSHLRCRILPSTARAARPPRACRWRAGAAAPGRARVAARQSRRCVLLRLCSGANDAATARGAVRGAQACSSAACAGKEARRGCAGAHVVRTRKLVRLSASGRDCCARFPPPWRPRVRRAPRAHGAGGGAAQRSACRCTQINARGFTAASHACAQVCAHRRGSHDVRSCHLSHR
jgi:hypothetical protein